MAEGAGLENRYTRKGIVGSNPTLSAVLSSLTPHHLKSSSQLGGLHVSYLDDHLLAGERIVYRARLHWTIFLTSIVVVLLGVALGILLQVVEPAYSYAGLALAGVGLLLAIGPAIRYISSEFAVTDKRVLGKLGFIERESDETLLSKVEAIGDRSGGDRPAPRIRHGHDHRDRRHPGVFPRISEPLEFRRQIQSQIIAQEERRGSSAGRGAGGRAERIPGRAGLPLLRRADPGAGPGVQALRPGRGTRPRVTADRLAGSILGQALGDALGFVVEAQPPEVARVYVEGWLRAGRAGEWPHPQFPFGQYSDDTQLARELLRSFRDAGGWQPSVFAGRLAELFRERRDVGAGRGTRSAALRLLMGVPWNESGTPAPYAGNGAAMRAGPLGLLLPDQEAMCRAAGSRRGSPTSIRGARPALPPSPAPSRSRLPGCRSTLPDFSPRWPTAPRRRRRR